MTKAADSQRVRPPQQARSRETLDRILDAAEGLVSEKGFEDTTVAEVVQRAESSVGAFYTRFPDKNALLYALYERYLEQAVATADEALAPERWAGADLAEVLDAVVRFLVSIYREQRGLIRTFVLRNHTDPAFRARVRVVWCRRTERGYRIGARFADAEDAFRARMVEQLCAIEDYRRRALEREGRHLSAEAAAHEWIERFADDFPRP